MACSRDSTGWVPLSCPLMPKVSSMCSSHLHASQHLPLLPGITVLPKSLFFPRHCSSKVTVLPKSLFFSSHCSFQVIVLCKSLFFPSHCSFQVTVLYKSLIFPNHWSFQITVLPKSLWQLTRPKYLSSDHDAVYKPVFFNVLVLWDVSIFSCLDNGIPRTFLLHLKRIPWIDGQANDVVLQDTGENVNCLDEFNICSQEFFCILWR